MDCPICVTPSTRKRHGTPYHVCDGCGLWFQSPTPPKVLHGEHEVWIGLEMPEQEKAANKSLASWLFEKALRGKPGPTLDIGASYPILAHYLEELGCVATAIDPDEEILKDHGLRVLCWRMDFETQTPPLSEYPYRLVSFVHSFEHIYDPLAAFHRLRHLIADDGALFIRMPDNQVEGYERDLTPGHFTIHPYFHALSSIAQICAQTNTFFIEQSYELKPGQRDMILRPIS